VGITPEYWGEYSKYTPSTLEGLFRMHYYRIGENILNTLGDYSEYTKITVGDQSGCTTERDFGNILHILISY